MRRRRDVGPLLYRERLEGRPELTRVDLRNIAFVAIMLTLIGVAGWLYLYQTSEVASYARQIRDLEQQRERLHREIIVQRAEVARLGSLRRVVGVGEELGYRLPEAIDATRRLYVAYAPPETNLLQGSVRVEGDTPGGRESGRRGVGLLQKLIAEFERWVASPLAGDE